MFIGMEKALQKCTNYHFTFLKTIPKCKSDFTCPKHETIFCFLAFFSCSARNFSINSASKCTLEALCMWPTAMDSLPPDDWEALRSSSSYKSIFHIQLILKIEKRWSNSRSILIHFPTVSTNITIPYSGCQRFSRLYIEPNEREGRADLYIRPLAPRVTILRFRGLRFEYYLQPISLWHCLALGFRNTYSLKQFEGGPLFMLAVSEKIVKINILVNEWVAKSNKYNEKVSHLYYV